MGNCFHIGTSGWNYDHWKGTFYPEDWPKKRWLEYYITCFDTVELNATFYRLPKEKTFSNWNERTPGHFQWAVKASRYITMHGFAFNVNTDLTPFQWILSCGIMNKGITSIKKLTGKEENISIVKEQVVHYFGKIFNLQPSWKDRLELKEILEESS